MNQAMTQAMLDLLHKRVEDLALDLAAVKGVRDAYQLKLVGALKERDEYQETLEMIGGLRKDGSATPAVPHSLEDAQALARSAIRPHLKGPIKTVKEE